MARLAYRETPGSRPLILLHDQPNPRACPSGECSPDTLIPCETDPLGRDCTECGQHYVFLPVEA